MLTGHCGKVHLATGFLQWASDYAEEGPEGRHADLVSKEDLPLSGEEKNSTGEDLT